MSTALPETIEAVKENFSYLDDWSDRYQYLIDLGQKLPPLDDSMKTAANRVEGCVSQVWMISRIENDKTNKSIKRFYFIADSDAHIVKGLIALLKIIYDGRPVDEINDIAIAPIFEEIGLSDNLLPNRRNGFFAMVERIKTEAAF